MSRSNRTAAAEPFFPPFPVVLTSPSRAGFSLAKPELRPPSEEHARNDVVASRHGRDGRARLFSLEHHGELLLVAERAAGEAFDAREVGIA